LVNTIVLAVTTDGRPENALEPVRLEVLRAVYGGASEGVVSVASAPELLNY